MDLREYDVTLTNSYHRMDTGYNYPTSQTDIEKKKKPVNLISKSNEYKLKQSNVIVFLLD